MCYTPASYAKPDDLALKAQLFKERKGTVSRYSPILSPANDKNPQFELFACLLCLLGYFLGLLFYQPPPLPLPAFLLVHSAVYFLSITLPRPPSNNSPFIFITDQTHPQNRLTGPTPTSSPSANTPSRGSGNQRRTSETVPTMNPRRRSKSSSWRASCRTLTKGSQQPVCRGREQRI